MKFEARVEELVESLPDLAGWWDHCLLSGGHYATDRCPASLFACHCPG